MSFLTRIPADPQIGYTDYSGKTIGITDQSTGAVTQCQVFIGVLGGSKYAFAEATGTQRLRDWIGSHVRMFDYFGGVPRVLVADNLKSAVTKADRFAPVLNESYRALCRHYGTQPFPARARKPKDKPKVEAAVLLVQRWILFRLRNRKFFSLSELNREIGLLLVELNAKGFQKLAGSRYSLWIEHERLALLPLPTARYEFAEWGKTRAGRDYHVRVDRHFYSVPFQLAGVEVTFCLKEQAVDLLFEGKVIAVHVRSFVEDGTTTLPEHRSPNHRAVSGWTEEQALTWANDVGPATAAMLGRQISHSRGYLMGYRTTEGMKSLCKKYGKDRLEAVCRYAIENKVTQMEGVRSILAKKIDLLLQADQVGSTGHVDHINLRGPRYYADLLATIQEKDHDEQHD